MRTVITPRDGNVCIEVTGKVAKLSTIVRHLSAGLDRVGIAGDAVLDLWYIENNLNCGEYDERVDDIHVEDGKFVNEGMIHYVNLTTDIDGNYIYGCVVLSRKYYDYKLAA